MARHDDASTYAVLLARLGDDGTKELFRRLLERALLDLLDTELTSRIGAGRHERSGSRSNWRNGARTRTLSTPAGDLELRIPKVRVGSFLPSLLEPRRRVDKALWAVIMTAYITGTSTRKVDDLVKALGCDTGVFKSTVLRICVEIDTQVDVFRTRRLDHLAFPYVFVDATYIKARVEHHIVSRAVVVATGVAADGNREVLGLDIGDSEDEVFWTQFLRSLRDRGLAGVKLVISDAHSGLKAAIGRVFQGSTWQRCRVHLMRNLLTHVPRGHKEMIAATVRTIFAQPTPKRPATNCGKSSGCSRYGIPTQPSCSLTLNTTSPLMPPSPASTGARSPRLIPSNGSIRRPNAARMWSVSSPTMPR